MNDDNIINAFAERGLSQRTIYHYLAALRRIHKWCKRHGHDLRKLKAGPLLEYADTLPRSHWSRRRLRSALNAYWDVIGRRNAPVRAIRVPAKPRMRSRALDDELSATLATHAQGRRDQPGAAVLLGLYLGLRRAEIAALRWADFDLDLAWLTIVGKGNVTDSLPVHRVPREALRQLDQNSKWVFPGRYGEHVSPTTIWTWSRRVSHDAGIGFVSTHILRHTCLTTANDATSDLRAVQTFARHARPETTAGYTRTSTKALLDVMNSLSYEAS